MRVLHGGVRLRLTLLFGGLFLVAGTALLGITDALVRHATSGVIIARQIGGASVTGPAPSAGLPPTEQILSYANAARSVENGALLLYSGIALGIMAVVSVALGWFTAGRALSPLRRITGAARRIAATNLHERLALDGPDDDLRELADTIDGLFARLDASLHAQRQFVANASHELRTPLARARTLLEVALRNPDASVESLRVAGERALAAGAEQERLIEALLTLARSQRGIGRCAPLDLAAITRDVLAVRGAEVTARGLEMEVSLSPALMAGDFGLSERAVANLIDNALRHNVADGAVWVTVAAVAGRAVLSVTNTGAEIPAGDVSRLLQPFQRRDAARSGDGLGLGLSIVQAIAIAHGGGLTLTPRPGGGLTVELSFPAADVPQRDWSSAQSERYARAAELRGANAVTGERSTDIRSITERAGMTV
jgi:signal transduction histidine kinase